MPPKRCVRDNFALVIPARFDSSRFPGKPLVDIKGTSLIERVWRRCVQAVPSDKVIVATDNAQIRQHCRSFGADVEMTSSSCPTGTDRVHEVATRRRLDWAINVQGDEPFVRPADIIAIREAFLREDADRVINAMAPIPQRDEWSSHAVPKVVFGHNDELLYMSRAQIPGSKKMLLQEAWKQVCIYAFSADHLNAFAQYGGRTLFESIEDIEILRFLELGVSVRMVRVDSGTIAVDYPEDIARAELIAEQMD